MFSAKRQMTSFDVMVGFCYWSWRFIFSHQISSQIDVTQAYETHFFSSDFIPKICFCCTFKLHLADWVWNLKCPTRYRAGEGKGLWELTGACTVSANLSEEEQWCAAFSSRLRMALLPVFSTLPSVQLKQPRVKFRVNFKVEPRTELLFSLTSTWKPEGSPPYNLWLSFLKKCLISILTSCSIGNTILFSSSSPCLFLFVEIIHLS